MKTLSGRGPGTRCLPGALPFVAAGLFVLWGWAAPVFGAIPSGQVVVSGLELAADARSVAPAGDYRYSGVMRSRRSGSPERELPAVCQIERKADTWQVTYRIGSGAQTETLVVRQGIDQTNQYSLSTNPAVAPAPLDPSAVDRAVAGTDFCVSDLGREYLFWPGQTILTKELPMRKSRACRVLQSTPAVTNAYARVLSWIDVDTGGVVMAEYYDAKGALVKEFQVKSVKEVKGIWHPQSLEVSHPRRNTRTVLEFQFKDD